MKNKQVGNGKGVKPMMNSSEDLFERNFWGRFPALCFDDPEDEYNELIGILRGVVQKYFKERKKL